MNTDQARMVDEIQDEWASAFNSEWTPTNEQCVAWLRFASPSDIAKAIGVCAARDPRPQGFESCLRYTSGVLHNMMRETLSLNRKTGEIAPSHRADGFQ